MTYDPTVAMELEKEHDNPSAGGKVSITAAGRTYTVDVVKMEQANDATGVVRKVRRMKTAGKEVGSVHGVECVCVCVCVCVYMLLK